MHKIDGAHLQYVNSHYAKFEYKGTKTVGVTDYTNKKPPMHFGWKKILSPTTVKNEKILINCAQNRRCTSSICEYDYTNLTPPMLFGRKNCLSSTHVKNEKIFIKCAQNRRCTSSMYGQSFGKV